MFFQLFAKFAPNHQRRRELSALVSDEMSVIAECREEIQNDIERAVRENNDVITDIIASKVDKSAPEFKKQSDIDVGAKVLRLHIVAAVLGAVFTLNFVSELALGDKIHYSIACVFAGLLAYGFVCLVRHDAKYSSVIDISEKVNAVWHLGEKHLYAFDRITGRVRIICYDTIRKAEVAGDHIGFYGRSGNWVVRMKNPDHSEPAEIVAKINDLVEASRK